jgi:hypothetical protein
MAAKHGVLTVLLRCVALADDGVLWNLNLMRSCLGQPQRQCRAGRHYSGTVTAAMEGAIQWCAWLCVSIDARNIISGPLEYEAAAQTAMRVITQLLEIWDCSAAPIWNIISLTVSEAIMLVCNHPAGRPSLS